MRRRPMRFLRQGRTRAPLGPTRMTLRLSLALAVLLLLLPATAAADDTPPVVTYSVNGIVGTNSWYRGSNQGNFIVVHWSASDPDGPLIDSSGCEPAIQVNGPNAGTTRTCWAKSAGGETTITTKNLKIDADPPTGVAAGLSRAPDFNGWYNHPVGVGWSGSDATSGIASCSSVAYSGPDRSSAPVNGGCTDQAGNGASAGLTLNYDATAPVLAKVAVASRAVSDVVQWASSSSADTAVVQRWARGNKDQPVVYRGSGTRFLDAKIQSSVEYMYSVQTFDQAGNASRKISIAGLPKVLTLRKLPYVPRAATKPVLRWGRVRHATYYHVQLFRGSKRILAAWPIKNELGLPAAWKWSGHRYRLSPGHYRWYLWAGIGRRSFAQYKTVGSARFIVPRR